MSKILKRPDYIKYATTFIRRGEWKQADVDQLENEPVLAQWDVPNAFMWSTSAWVHHTLILFIPVILTIFFYLDLGFTYMPIGMTVLFTFVFGTLYYFARSQYHHIGYKISKSGLLMDNLKVYPRFRYGNQDPTKFLRGLRVVGVFLVIFALLVNPYYLMGAGSAIFLSFIKPQIDSGEEALYVPYLWNSTKYNFTKINLVPSRRIVAFLSEDRREGCRVFCTKENYQQIVQLIKQHLPDAEVVENERVF